MKVLIVLCLAVMALADEKKSYDKHDGYVSYSSKMEFLRNKILKFRKQYPYTKIS